MRNSTRIIFLAFLSFCEAVNSQETCYGPGYQTMVMNNPAFAGSEYDGTMRLSYMNFYPGNNYNFHSFFISYDSYFELLHGGAGAYIASDHIGGIMNDLRGGLSYSYFLQAGRELYINGGLSAGFFSRGFNFSGAVFPDEIDPMGGIGLPTADLQGSQNRTVFDVGTGILFIYRNISGGLSITHLSEPDTDGRGSPAERLERKLLVHLSADLGLKRWSGLKLVPAGSFELQGDYQSLAAGAVVESNNLSVSGMIIMENSAGLDCQAGFSVRLDRMSLFYSYRFNIASESRVTPFSLMHQTGLSFRFNNVEKRIKGRTINAPDM
ncbi:MAG: PorP/SprF family type IX secretion system membrane protein [Bacteroidales bacterium]|nr:PorP/SprF family type IX secretion system membrane protein [Bacteroidales bacterium]